MYAFEIVPFHLVGWLESRGFGVERSSFFVVAIGVEEQQSVGVLDVHDRRVSQRFVGILDSRVIWPGTIPPRDSQRQGNDDEEDHSEQHGQQHMTGMKLHDAAGQAS
jgi:hypothetical protein